MRWRIALIGTSGILAASIAITGAASAATPADPHYDYKAHWRVVLQTSKNAHSGFLAIAASGPRSAWAVGYTGNTNYLVRWNGASWRRMALPAHFNAFGVSGSSPSDVYVFGNLTSPSGPNNAKVYRWNGRSWSLALTAGAFAIIDIRPRNVWVESATGHLDHWDGASWTRTAYRFALKGYPGTLTAVGQQLWRADPGVVGGHARRLVIRRWTGSGWQEVSSPHPRIPDRSVPQISASGRNNVWVNLSGRSPEHSVRLLHWDGKTWTTLIWPWQLGSLAAGRVAAVGHSSAWFGEGTLLRSPTGWHLPNDFGCGVPVGVPRTNSALCAGTGVINPLPGGRSYGVISQSGPLP
jgi:hypothetical protein